MFCKCKKQFKVYRLCKENAEEVLDELGFGKDLCMVTREKDGRFGVVECDHISFGFRNKRVSRLFFGNYVLIDILFEGNFKYLGETEFLENYEIVDKIDTEMDCLDK